MRCSQYAIKLSLDELPTEGGPGLFLQVTDGVITDPFVLNWLDLLCFLLSGLPANGTIAAEVAFMFNEWYRPNSSLEFPRGGSQAMVNALVRCDHDMCSQTV